MPLLLRKPLAILDSPKPEALKQLVSRHVTAIAPVFPVALQMLKVRHMQLLVDLRAALALCCFFLGSRLGWLDQGCPGLCVLNPLGCCIPRPRCLLDLLLGSIEKVPLQELGGVPSYLVPQGATVDQAL